LGDHEYSGPTVGDHEYSLAEEIWSPGKPYTNIAITTVINVPTRAALNSNRHGVKTKGIQGKSELRYGDWYHCLYRWMRTELKTVWRI